MLSPIPYKTELLYITGGARSGKSHYAEQLAITTGQPVTYLATAQVFDAEMSIRISRHRAERPAHWLTVEEPLEVAQAAAQVQTPVLLLDCLSLWVSNMLLAEWPDEQVLCAADALLSVLAQRSGRNIVVSNEVGLGIVPDNALARRYRDLLGWVNQRAAAASTGAFLLVSGLPVRLK